MSVLKMFANVASAAVPTDEDKTTVTTGTGTDVVTTPASTTKTNSPYPTVDMYKTTKDASGNEVKELKSPDEYRKDVETAMKPYQVAIPKQLQADTTPIDYQSILKGINQKNAEEDEKERKLAHSRATMSAIGDGLNAIFNLVGTMNGKKNYVSDDPSKTLSGQNLARYEKYLADTKQARKDYADLQTKLASIQAQENNRNIASTNAQNKQLMDQYYKEQSAQNAWTKKLLDDYNVTADNERADKAQKRQFQHLDTTEKNDAVKTQAAVTRANKTGKGGSKGNKEAIVTKLLRDGTTVRGTAEQIAEAERKLNAKKKISTGGNGGKTLPKKK